MDEDEAAPDELGDLDLVPPVGGDLDLEQDVELLEPPVYLYAEEQVDGNHCLHLFFQELLFNEHKSKVEQKKNRKNVFFDNLFYFKLLLLRIADFLKNNV